VVLAGQGEGKDDGGVTLVEVGEEPTVDPFEVVLEGGVEAGGEDREAFVVAFWFADEDLAVVEVQIFDPQAEAFHEAQAAAVEELGHELVFAGEVAEDQAGFVAPEDGGDAACGASAGGADRSLEGQAEDGAVQEEDGAEGLILGGGGDAFLDGEVSEKGLDLGWAEVLRGCDAGETPGSVRARAGNFARCGASSVCDAGPSWRARPARVAG